MRRLVAAALAAAFVLTSVAAATAAERRANGAPRSAADPAGRWIVVLKSGTDVQAATSRQGKRLGFATDRMYRNLLRGYSARLDTSQVAALRKDTEVAYVVPDEKIEVEAQLNPTGISRIGARQSAAAQIDGVDQRVDADVAVVDTGVATVADLNVVGGYNCSTSNHGLWRDVYGHGTHVAGTIGAIDNGTGVVGVAPGVRIWAVKILDDTGAGLLSWYVCGLDWIAAQKDPADPSKPRFEAVNMSVAKYGSDDGNCGATNKDVLHAAICRLVASGVTVAAAAANDSSSAAARVPAAYNEVITVSALADTDGKPGGLGGHLCYSWGSYDDDDTFANFSNYGSDVDLIAPGKCIWSTVPTGYQYMSGTSMATPHVSGAIALLKASRPYLNPAEVKEALQYLGTMDWKITSDPDPYHEKLLDVSRLGPRGDFSVAAGGTVIVPEVGGTAEYPITVTRSPTSFERIGLRAEGLPAGARATFDKTSLYGFEGVASTMTVTVALGTIPGTYPFRVIGNEHGLAHGADATLIVQGDAPTAAPPVSIARPHGIVSAVTIPAQISWPAATDPSNPIGGYEIQVSVDGAGWVAAGTTAGTVQTALVSQTLGHTYQYRLRARDIVGTWSAWVAGATVSSAYVQDSSTAVAYLGTWTTSTYSGALGGTERYATAAGATARTRFVGGGVALVSHQGPAQGSAKVYIDRIYRGTVSLYRSTTLSKVVMYTIAFPTYGTHTIEIRAVGNGRIDLDAFVIQH